MPDWDITVGATLPRSELHDRWGGARRGGMEPSVKAASVFLFSKPSVGEAYGYKYDGWHSDGTFHYTGDGQEGDQDPSEGGNRALLKAAELGRAIRLFRSEGRDTTYMGQFVLADPPYYRADASDRNKEMRSVLVFRLVAGHDVLREVQDAAGPDGAAPQELPLEAANVDEYVVNRPDEPPVAVRREADLVRRYATWLETQGQQTVRHRIPIPGGGHLFTDVYNKATSELLEAKASSARVYVRSALGQLLDYSRYLPHASRGVLLPSRPSDDLVELLKAYSVAVVWPARAGFERQDPD